MPDNTTASYKTRVEKSQARIEASIANISDTLEVILAEIRAKSQSTFAELVRAGKEDAGTLARYIAEFHESGATGPLHDHLGLTKDELLALLNDPKDFHWILGDVTDTPEEE